jgi:two-component system LytT family sensor kinase
LPPAAILLDGLHGTFNSALNGNLIGYSTGLLISVLLLVLTIRAARLPGTPLANIAFAGCAFVWCLGGLVYTAAGIPFAKLFQYTAALAVPIPVLATWNTRRLCIYASLAAAALVFILWSGHPPLATLRPVIAWYAAAVLLLGFLSLRPDSLSRAIYVPSLIIVAAACSGAILATIRVGSHLAFLLSHLILFAVLCAFFLFARFRYADVFVRYAVRIVLAATLAASLIYTVQTEFLLHIAGRAPSAGAVHVFAMLAATNLVLLSLTFLDEAISRTVMRWLFHAPDYRAEARELGARLSLLQAEPEIAAAVEDAARRPLELAAARVQQPPDVPALLDGELVELDFQVLVPIYSDGRVTRVLRVEPGPRRPALVSRDLHYLRGIAAQCGNRLDALHRERESVERQSREALLLQQVTEAELRALRAQINPHFLFNSLNTIADLIVRDPARAETMTVRLASVFRHVLAHSSRPLTTVHDEMEFLRAYLYIEEVRFGDRLTVRFVVAPEIAGARIPSLILQPLVENALKHGLAPKPGAGHLWITAGPHDGHIRLRVEDDGLGLNAGGSPDGLGLANIAERLRTLYRNDAAVTLEKRDGGGAVATILIPRAQAVDAL